MLTIIAFVAGATFTSCQSSTTKVENAKEKMEEARQKLDQALRDSIQKFKKESEDKIIVYEKGIADLKAGIIKENKENKALYEKKLAELEQKNSDLKKKLGDYKEENIEKWIAFKTEFAQDMDGLEKALKEFTITNKK